jgi:hypothetical protein
MTSFVGISGGKDWDQSYAGAGVVDSAAQIVKSIQDGDGLSIGANMGAAAIDALGFVENPIKAIGTTAIGWLLEHISFLDWFLDHTAGDPQQVQNAAETFFQAAQDLDGVAADQIRAYGPDVPTYREGGSPSAQEFETRVAPRGAELKTLSLQCLGLGETMNAAGMLVATTRGVIRDLLTEFAWWVVKKGTIALAAAPYTGGGSLAALLTDTTIVAAKLAKKFADKLGTLAKDLDGLFGKLQALTKVLGEPTRRALGIGLAKNLAPSIAKGIDDHVTPSAADAAEQQVAEHEANEAKPPPFESLNPPGPRLQGPGLGAWWTTSGTLDE